MFFTRHSQIRCRECRELDLAKVGLLQGWYDGERDGQESYLCVQGSDLMKSYLVLKGNEDLRR